MALISFTAHKAFGPCSRIPGACRRSTQIPRKAFLESWIRPRRKLSDGSCAERSTASPNPSAYRWLPWGCRPAVPANVRPVPLDCGGLALFGRQGAAGSIVKRSYSSVDWVVRVAPTRPPCSARRAAEKGAFSTAITTTIRKTESTPGDMVRTTEVTFFGAF